MAIHKFTVHGRRREMGYGSYPSIGPADAGTSAVKCRRQVARVWTPSRRAEWRQNEFL